MQHKKCEQCIPEEKNSPEGLQYRLEKEKATKDRYIAHHAKRENMKREKWLCDEDYSRRIKENKKKYEHNKKSQKA